MFTNSKKEKLIEKIKSEILKHKIKPINDYEVDEFAVFRRHGRFLWDSRVDGIEYATTSKGSAIVRVGQLNWYGKEINVHVFPQKSQGTEEF